MCTEGIRMSYAWGMPTSNTFQCMPIGLFVQRYLADSTVSVDPFARNCAWATHTNDLNPDTLAKSHMDALDFLAWCLETKIHPDLVIFDPPFSPRQLKECYEGIGRSFTQEAAQRTGSWSPEKDLIAKIIEPGGYVLSFGWNVTGMGKSRGFVKREILVVDHGAQHNATLCLAEQILCKQLEMF